MSSQAHRSGHLPRLGRTAVARAVVLPLALALASSLPTALASAGIIEFYPVAAARTEKPLDPKKLKASGDLEIDGFHLALWGSDPRRPDLFSMTPFRVTKPAEQLAIPGGIRAKEGPSPAQDWGYVFDRNGDGRVDYLCYFMGPMPIEGADFPADFPKREASGKLRLKKEHIEFLVRHMKAVFYHVADDDFDGRADGVVIFSTDPDRDWVDGWGLFRSTKGDGDLDDARRFRFDITKPTGTPERVEGGWAWLGFRGERKTVSPTVLEGWSAILGRINVAVAAFELKPGSLPKQ